MLVNYARDTQFKQQFESFVLYVVIKAKEVCTTLRHTEMFLSSFLPDCNANSIIVMKNSKSIFLMDIPSHI